MIALRQLFEGLLVYTLWELNFRLITTTESLSTAV